LHQDAANPSNSLNKSQFRDLIQRIAHGLRHSYGIGANGRNKDVVTVMSYGSIMIPTAFFGVIAAGGVYSAASPSSTVSELARQISIGKSKLVICSEEHIEVAKEAAKQCNVSLDRVLVLSSSPERKLESLGTGINAVSSNRLPWTTITDRTALKNSLITILWSSGTTGLPKGVMLSHENLVAECYITALSGRAWAEAEVAKGTFTPVEYRALAHLPISHIAGLFGYFIAPIYAGGTVMWMRRYRWDDLLKYLKQYKITAFYTVPSIWLRIAKSKEITDHFKYVEGAATGAAPMDGVLQTAASGVLANPERAKSVSVGQTWGLSETTGAVTAVPKGEIDVSGSIGSVLPNVELRLVDEDFRGVGEEGEEGELIVRSPLVTNGYFNNEEATRGTFRDGWFCTGDIAVRRSGKFFVVDRKKVSAHGHPCSSWHTLGR
jgi:long-subunit acyl-CoA synthetase (AMP-forming)